MRFSRLLSILLFCLEIANHPLQAQIPKAITGGAPKGSKGLLILPTMDNEELRNRDKTVFKPGTPFQYAEPVKVLVTPQTHGVWETQLDGSRVWTLHIISTGATSLNLGFTRFFMPASGAMIIYSVHGDSFVGPFTADQNESHGQLWTPIIEDDEIIVEVNLPADEQSSLLLELTSVNHGYVDFRQPTADKSASCNVDVICPEADDWRDQIQSVAAISTGGSLFCTGFLVNNTAQDRKPFFMTANHCGIDSGNAASLVVYWNFQNSTCRPVGSPESGEAGDGSLAEFNTGSFFRSANDSSDFTLVELDDPVDPAVNPFFAGWDRTSSFPTSAVGIHHPDTDEKRISFENDPTVPGSEEAYIRVTEWDLGITAAGSSGSPLFNQDHRVVGQLQGGGSFCGAPFDDFYGRFSISWEGGGTSSTRLRDWLDPVGTEQFVLDGLGNGISASLSPVRLALCRPTSEATTEVHTFGGVSGSTSPITLAVSGLPVGATSSFSLNPVTPPGSSVLTIGNLGSVPDGTYFAQVVASSSTESVTRTLPLSIGSPGTINLSSPTNGAIITWPDVATFEWMPDPNSSYYLLEVGEDFLFNNLILSVTTDQKCFDPTPSLNTDSSYYWRVTGINPCGASPSSSVFSFENRGFPICDETMLEIPTGDPMGVTSSIILSEKGILTDLNVYLGINHTYVKNLSAKLTHVDTGTTITLFDQLQCEGASIDATLDDEAMDPVVNPCETLSPPAIHGTLAPISSLSGFDGESLAGTWTLNVADLNEFEIGFLVEWCLLPSYLIPPSVTCTAHIVSPASLGQCNGLVAFAPQVSGSSTTLEFRIGGESITSPHLFPVGDTVVDCTATNPVGSATCSFTVTVQDLERPTAICQTAKLYLNEIGSVTLDGVMLDGGSYDNCGIASVVADPTSFTCAESGINDVTLTVIDIHGNVSSCTTTVEVIDNSAPLVTLPIIEPIVTGEVDAEIPDYTGLVMAVDNCTVAGDLIIVQNPSPGTRMGPGMIDIEITVTDLAGNVKGASSPLLISVLAPSPTATSTITQTQTHTVGPSPTATQTATEGPSATATETPTNEPSPTLTNTQAEGPTPSATQTSTEGPSPTTTETSTEGPSPTVTETSTEGPSPTASETATEEPSPTATDTTIGAPSPTPTDTRNYDVKPEVVDGEIDAQDLLEWFKQVQSGSEEANLLFDFSRFWQTAD